MVHARLFQAIILRTVDVGEADRLCVIFTREAGRKAARAKSVRKPGSRMGGVLLAFRHVQLEMIDRDDVSIVTSARDMGTHGAAPATFDGFIRAQQGVELLLQLTEDNEPLPRIFDLLLEFLTVCFDTDDDALVAFHIRLLGQLGLLPANIEDRRFERLSQEGRAFIDACVHGVAMRTLAQAEAPADVRAFLGYVLEEQLARPLRSQVVANSL